MLDRTPPGSGRAYTDVVLGLYVHIPFCASICNYCNFNRGLFDRELKDRYLSALISEIAAAATSRDVVEKLTHQAAEPAVRSPQQFRDFIKAEHDKYERIVKTVGIKPE